MDKSELIEIMDYFILDFDMWEIFVKFLKDRYGYTPEELGFENE